MLSSRKYLVSLAQVNKIVVMHVGGGAKIKVKLSCHYLPLPSNDALLGGA